MIGTTLGSYKVLSEIGSGGMGVVYLAEHTLLGRKAAVKLLRADMPDEYVERFFNEAKAAASLHHPGLVDVFDFGHATDGSAYIVMEFLPGESLAERLAREPKLPVPLALVITRAVALALAVAHEQGIIHRDLKPGNIFLVPDNEAAAGLRTKVLDFGIAKLMRDRDSRSVKTQSGAVIGTPRYMSPEQCKNARDVDGRSDIYSLGCILYETVLGVPPFDYDSWAELVGAHIYEEPARPREIDANVPEDVETLITKLLEKNPDDRFRNMQELAQSLEVLLLTHGAERIRLTPTSLKRTATPARGVVRAKSADATLPQSGERITARGAPSSATETGEYADTREIASVSEPEAVAPPAPVTPPATVLPARRPPYLAFAIAGAGLVALAVAATVVLRKDEKPPAETAFIVVDQRASGSSESAVKPTELAVQAPDDPAREPTANASKAGPPSAPDAGSAKTTQAPPKNPNEIDVAALTRTFGRQGPAITGCFKTHGEPSAPMSVRFQIDASGTVKSVEILPPSVGTSDLGGCIGKVAKSTRFGIQPTSATFRVPLYTR